MELGDLPVFASAELNSTTVTLALLAVFTVLLYWYSTSAFSKLSKVGIRHPPPLPFIGNLLFFRENHRIIEWPGLKRTTTIIEFQPPCYVQVTNHQTRLPRATSSLALNSSRDGASTASLGNLFQCVTTL